MRPGGDKLKQPPSGGRGVLGASGEGQLSLSPSLCQGPCSLPQILISPALPSCNSAPLFPAWLL